MPGHTLLAAAATALSVSLVAACASTPETHAYKLYPGPARPAVQLAIVRMDDAMAAEFDGRPVSASDWTEVQLLPGEHEIRWATEFGVSVMVDPRMFVTGGHEARVMLAAGHLYSLRADRTKGPGYEMYFWIVDDTAGQVIAGTPKP